MVDEIFVALIVGIGVAAITGIFANMSGYRQGKEDAADESLLEQPSPYWQRALIDARARAEKARVK